MVLPSAAALVTGNSAMPHGTMPVKSLSVGDRFTANPCSVTHWRMRTPIAPILA